MTASETPNCATAAGHRTCLRRGCGHEVKKPTAKYCSIRCCSLDPERRQRLRISARRSRRVVLPMTQQLRLGLSRGDLESELLGRLDREDVPRGLSRLCS